MKNLETVLLLNLCLILEHSTSLKNKLNPTEAKISSQLQKLFFLGLFTFYIPKVFFFYYDSKSHFVIHLNLHWSELRVRSKHCLRDP